MRPFPALPARVRRPAERVAGALRRRVQQVHDREQAAARDHFSNHYLIRAPGAGRPPPLLDGWTHRSVGGYTYHLHPGTPVTVAGRVVVIGRPVDVDRASTDAGDIALRLSSTWATLGRGAGPDDATQALASDANRLAGRWVIVLHDLTPSGGPGPLTVLTDAQASVPVVTRDGIAAAASHADHLPVSGTTPSDEATVTVPSHSWLRVTPDAAPSARLAVHRHWYPAGQQGATDPEALYTAFRDRFVEHVRLLSGLGTPVLSLTGGVRSRATLAAYLQHPRPGGLALTFYDPESARIAPDQANDLFGASDLAYRVGLPHRVFRPGDPLTSVLPQDAVELRSSAGLLSPEPQPVVPEAASHEVLLPFNDRVLAELWHSQPAHWRADEVLLRRLAAEAPSVGP